MTRLISTTLVAGAALLWATNTARADVPSSINFQGRMADAAGSPLSGAYSMTFQLFDASSNGTACLPSPFAQTVTMASGLFNVAIAVDTSACTFDKPYWIEVTISGEVLQPRIPLASAGYAFTSAGVVRPGTTNRYIPGNAAGEMALNNGVLNSTLNADMVDGKHANVFAEAIDIQTILQTNGGALTTYVNTRRRYIVEVTPAKVGIVQPLHNATLNQLCMTKTGCTLTIQMINWDANQPGNIASRQAQLFFSESSGWWRLSNDVSGLNASGSIHEWRAWDCWFTDAETSTNSSNGRADNTMGWGVFNCKGCDYSDSTTTCRFVFDG